MFENEAHCVTFVSHFHIFIQLPWE